jgi:hypothetical protein
VRESTATQATEAHAKRNTPSHTTGVPIMLLTDAPSSLNVAGGGNARLTPCFSVSCASAASVTETRMSPISMVLCPSSAAVAAVSRSPDVPASLALTAPPRRRRPG